MERCTLTGHIQFYDAQPQGRYLLRVGPRRRFLSQVRPPVLSRVSKRPAGTAAGTAAARSAVDCPSGLRLRRQQLHTGQCDRVVAFERRGRHDPHRAPANWHHQLVVPHSRRKGLGIPHHRRGRRRRRHRDPDYQRLRPVSVQIVHRRAAEVDTERCDAAQPRRH